MTAVATSQHPAAPTARAAQPSGQLLRDWLLIDPQGLVTVFCGKVEVGQGARTSLCQIVADELGVPLPTVSIVLADTDQTPFDQGTFGSRTTATMGVQLRRAAAGLREELRQRAATAWGVDVTALEAVDGSVRHRVTGRTLGYAALATSSQVDGAIGDNPGKPAQQWSLAGSSIPKARAIDIVTGRHRYTPDLSMSGMLYGRVLRSPRPGATIGRLDDSAALAVPGVVVVHEGEFVGVAAPSARAVAQALAALRVEWLYPEQGLNGELSHYLRTHLDEPSPSGRPAAQQQESGDVAGALTAAPVRAAATYTTAFIAHAPLETRAALAEWQGNRLSVWTGTQRPFGVREQLAAAFGMTEADIRVIVPDTGSAYGGKHTGEAALEAARLARVAQRPVKVIWSREEEFTQAYLRPAAVIDVTGAVDRAGTLLAWECHNYNAGPGALPSPYRVANQRVAYHPVRSPLRQGSYRALAATANIFARESHMDELASLVGMNPLEFRLRNLDDDRLRAVLTAASERFGWDAAVSHRDTGIGIACGTEKGGYVACCTEIAVNRSDGSVAIRRIVQAYECGVIVNPANVQNQVVGAIVQGLGGALYEQIELVDGRIVNPRFSRYRVPRFSDIPLIEVVLLNRTDLASAGAGETPITAVAPAIGNAIYAATGVRLRAMPLLPAGALFLDDPAQGDGRLTQAY